MPRIKTVVSGSIRPSRQQGRFSNVRGITADAFGGAAARALGSLGEGIGQLGVALGANEGKQEEFRQLKAYNEFKTAQNISFKEQQRNVTGDGAGFVKAQSSRYDAAAAQFLKDNIRERDQAEYQARISTHRGQQLQQSTQFQFQVEDDTTRAALTDEMTKAQLVISGDPLKLAQEKARMLELLEAANLSEQEKIVIARKIAVALEATSFKETVRRDPEEVGSLGVGPASSITAKIVQAESGGRATAKNPKSSATGAGQFIAGTWLALVREHRPNLAAGRTAQEILDLRNDPEISADMVDVFAQENEAGLRASNLPVNEGTVYLAHFAGLGGARNLLFANPNTPVVEVLGQDKVDANPHLKGMNAGQVIQWAQNKMKGIKTVTANSRYSSIPFEQRESLTNDALRGARMDTANRVKMEKARQDSQINSLLNGVSDGTVQQTDINTARGSVLGDWDDFQKVQRAYDKKIKDNITFETGVAKMASPEAIWDPTAKDDKKRVNALWAQGGGEKQFEEHNPQYITSAYIPQITQTQMIPTESLGTLRGMVRQPEHAAWAFDVLNQIERSAPEAYSSQVPDDLTKAVATWNQLSQYTSQEIIMQKLAEQRTPEGRAAQEASRVIAQNELLTIDNSAILDHFDPGVFSMGPDAPIQPGLNAEMRKDFDALFVDAFSTTFDKDSAQQIALKGMEKRWGFSEIGGGGKRMLKHPPEKHRAYGAIDGSHSWIDQQARSELGFDEDREFFLTADAQTRKEFDSDTPPSYLVITQDDDGAFFVELNDDNSPKRIFFDRAQSLKQNNERIIARHNAQVDLNIVSEYDKARELEYLYNTPIPKELQSEYDRVVKESQESRDEEAETRRLEAIGADTTPILEIEERDAPASVRQIPVN